MTQATYTVPGNPADPAGGAREVSQEFTAMLLARGASRAWAYRVGWFLGRRLLSARPKGLPSSMRVSTSPLIMGVCPVEYRAFISSVGGLALTGAGR
jgi:hypothetical protein